VRDENVSGVSGVSGVRSGRLGQSTTDRRIHVRRRAFWAQDLTVLRKRAPARVKPNRAITGSWLDWVAGEAPRMQTLTCGGLDQSLGVVLPESSNEWLQVFIRKVDLDLHHSTSALRKTVQGRLQPPLDPSAVVSRMNEPVLLNVNSVTAEPWARVNAPPAQHDDQQQRDSDNEPANHETSLQRGLSSASTVRGATRLMRSHPWSRTWSGPSSCSCGVTGAPTAIKPSVNGWTRCVASWLR
jgi:hypothetical protein